MATPLIDDQVRPAKVWPVCRVIVDQPATGTWNMAVDQALLDAAIVENIATLRLYRWSEPTLSLGYFQSLNDRHQHKASSTCNVVRRQSGGGAILHDRELTYSLALPAGHPLAHDATKLYAAFHGAIVELLTSRLDRAAADWKLAMNCEESRFTPADEPFLCFQRRARGDVLLVANRDCEKPAAPLLAYKILGSAQRRHRGAILQHGSLLLAKSPAAPELPGWQELTSQSLAIDELMTGVVRQMGRLVGEASEYSPLPVAIHQSAEAIQERRYMSRSWTTRR
jgi:lipoate-protein ligase A